MTTLQPLQLPFVRDESDKRQTLLLDVPTAECVVSRFNTRKTRDAEHVRKLAQRMLDHGYEMTRAVWAYRNGTDKLEVFAGGTRLEAASQAGIPVAVILFEGYDETEISRLGDRDNENDEYHQPVGIVDVWAEYARLSDEEGWTQERIARAKGVSQPMVAERISLHRMPETVKRFISQGLLDERHLSEIRSLSAELYFAPWLTSEAAWLELAELAAKGVAKNGKKTVRATGDDVRQWKEFVAYAQEVYRSLQPVTLYRLQNAQPELFAYDAPQAFVQELARRKARGLVEVKAAEGAIRIHIADNLNAYEHWIQHTTASAARQAAKSRREAELLGRFVHGDCLAAASQLTPGSVRLLLMDPPYGQDYQSNRRWRSEAPPKLENDTTDASLSLLTAILDAYGPALAEDAHLLIFCNWQNEPRVRSIIERRWKVRGSLIWAKEEHSAGDLDGAFGPSHERIIHATQGRPIVRPRLRDVFQFARELTWPHPTVKPQGLLRALIGSCTAEGDLVIDPTAGIASTLVAAQATKRRFWGCESDDNWHQIGCKRLLEGMND